jgi:hypothetical protein
LKNKTSQSIYESFEKYLNQYGYPNELIADNGKEFVNKKFEKLMNDHKVFHKLVEPDYHKTLGIIDRFCRTIKEKLFKYFYDNNTTKWIDKLDNVVEICNQTPHSSLGDLSPNEVNANDITKQYVRMLNMQKIKQTKSQTITYKVGQIVRFRLKRPIFTKGYRQIWSSNIFTIQKIHGINATLDDGNEYKLSNLQIVTEPDREIEKEKEQHNETNEIAKVERKAKIKQYTRKEGVEESNIKTLPRNRKQREFFNPT